MRHCLLTVIALLLTIGSARGDDLAYKDRLLDQLVKQVPVILKSFDSEIGRFGGGIWICQDQHPMYPLAVAYTFEADDNPYYHDPKLLEVIIKAGDPLLENMNERGQWVFQKKDGSTWGNIWMPWTYSRWVRTFGLIRDAMPPESRKTWTDALTLGYTGISQTQLKRVHNIPTHHAMGLYAAGKALDRPEWCRQAADFMIKVLGKQSEGGYWSEGTGPVVAYDFVYVDALGTYYTTSGDERVLSALEKAAAFHRHFTYPGGQNVETVDQRNPYHATISLGNVGFTFTPTGRTYLENQWARYADRPLNADLIASLLLYGEEGPIEPLPPGEPQQTFVLAEGNVDRAITVRHGPWFFCLSAYTAPIPTSRWIQDRQNLVSIYHDRTGLILGGGNTKLQPAWSSFTVGDTSLLKHTPGDTSPDFLPKGKLYHIPSAARLVHTPDVGLDLTYGPETCRVGVRPVDENRLEYTLEATASSDLPVAAHLTLIPHLDQPLQTATGQEFTVGDDSIELSAEQVGGRVSHAGYRLHLPASASLRWPALPHNPYRKDGRASPHEGRIAIRIPFDSEHRKHQVTFEIVE